MKKMKLSPQEFKSKLQTLTGKVLWSALAGPSTGSSVSLKFGKKILRSKPLQNELLTEDERLYDGEIGIMIYCGWRIEIGNDVVCGSGDSNEIGGPMLKGLETILGKRVRAICWPAYWDMEIRFEDKSVLRLFCDIGEIGQECYAFFFNSEDLIYYVEDGNCFLDMED